MYESYSCSLNKRRRENKIRKLVTNKRLNGFRQKFRKEDPDRSPGRLRQRRQACCSPDQAVVDGAAAGEEPRLGGGASGGAGGQQRVGEAVPRGSRPALYTNTRPRAETEAEDAKHRQHHSFRPKPTTHTESDS